MFEAVEPRFEQSCDLDVWSGETDMGLARHFSISSNCTYISRSFFGFD